MPATSQPLAIFGDLYLGIWGLLIAGEEPRLALAGLSTAPAGIALEPATLDREDDGAWALSAGAGVLTLEKAQASTATPGDGLPLEPLRVTGTATVAGEQREIDIAGVLIDPPADPKTESLRLVGSWFPAGHQVSLLSARAKGAKGQDKDRLDVVALGEDGAVVFDPRLSTTYGADGDPRRAGIEIWIGADPDGEQYPRRVAGVATGSSVSEQADGLRVSAHALRCLSRGEAGVGVYVLVAPA